MSRSKNTNITKNNRSAHSLSPGNMVLLRTAVHSWAGRVRRTLKIEGVAFVELEAASWVADTGRYHEALRDGLDKASLAEIEPAPVDGIVTVQIGAIGDIAPLPSLPREVR